MDESKRMYLYFFKGKKIMQILNSIDCVFKIPLENLINLSVRLNDM